MYLGMRLEVSELYSDGSRNSDLVIRSNLSHKYRSSNDIGKRESTKKIHEILGAKNVSQVSVRDHLKVITYYFFIFLKFNVKCVILYLYYVTFILTHYYIFK